MNISRRLSTKTLILSLLLSIALLTGCYTVPETNRRSLVLIDEVTEIQLGLSAYSQARTETPISIDPTYNRRVMTVGNRISTVANKPSYQWDFTVFDAPDTVNAWCLPGGKIGIYTGLFKLVHNESQLAFVMSHEVGHAVAKHGAERISHGLLLAAGSEVIASTMDNETAEDQKKVQQVRAAYGIGSTLFIMLPFSRKHEYEADRIGLMYMSDAGYDPREAVRLQKEFIEYHEEKGSSMPEYLSTHPSDKKRLAQMEELLPEAMRRYSRATGQELPAEFQAGNEIPGAKVNYNSGGQKTRKSHYTGVKLGN